MALNNERGSRAPGIQILGAAAQQSESDDEEEDLPCLGCTALVLITIHFPDTHALGRAGIG